MKKSLMLALVLVLALSVIANAQSYPTKEIELEIVVSPWAELNIEGSLLQVLLDRPGVTDVAYLPFEIMTNTDVEVSLATQFPTVTGKLFNQVYSDASKEWKNALAFDVQINEIINNEPSGYEVRTSLDVDKGSKISNYGVVLRAVWHEARKDGQNWWNVFADTYEGSVTLTVAAR